MCRIIPRLIFLLVALTVLPAQAEKPPDEEALALIRQVTGPARIACEGNVRPALPFTSLERGDTIYVDGGRVVVYLRSGQEQILGSGSRYIVTPVPEAPETALWTRIVEAVKAVLHEPRSATMGVTRGPGESDVPAWPDGGRFSMGSHILFQWPDSVEAGRLSLRGLAGSNESRQTVIQHPTSPMEWPSELPRLPGLYRWEIRRSATEPILGSWDFAIISDAEANAVRTEYRSQAGGPSPSVAADILGEIMAARARCYLQ